MIDDITIADDMPSVTLEQLQTAIYAASAKVEENKVVFSILSDLVLGMLSQGLKKTTIDLSDLTEAQAAQVKTLIDPHAESKVT